MTASDPTERPPEDQDRLSDAGRPRQGRIHLVLGPVGAGKSTFAAALAWQLGAVRLTLDQWVARLFSPDRPERGVREWYVERAARALGQIWSVAQDVAACGVDVVLEVGLIRRGERERFYAGVDESGLELTIHVLDAPREVRRARVAERNRRRGATFAMLVPPEVFELASDLWEPLGAAERSGRDVREPPGQPPA